MSITTTITYVSPPGGTATVTGSPVSLQQDASGMTLHAGKQVDNLHTKISSTDTNVLIHVASTASHKVIVDKVTVAASPVPSDPDVGGATWVGRGTSQEITITAATVVGNKRTYTFDSPPQPLIKLKVTVERA